MTIWYSSDFSFSYCFDWSWLREYNAWENHDKSNDNQKANFQSGRYFPPVSLVFFFCIHQFSPLENKFHRNIQQFGMKGISKDRLIQRFCYRQRNFSVKQIAQSPVQSSTLPGMEFKQLLWATSSTVSPSLSNFFLVVNLNLPSCSLRTLLLLLSVKFMFVPCF